MSAGKTVTLLAGLTNRRVWSNLVLLAVFWVVYGVTQWPVLLVLTAGNFWMLKHIADRQVQESAEPVVDETATSREKVSPNRRFKWVVPLAVRLVMLVVVGQLLSIFLFGLGAGPV